MECKIVSIKELEKDNPTLCLSALRVFKKCFECEVYKRAKKRNRLDKIKCNPQIDKNLVSAVLQKRKEELEKQIQKIDEEMEAKADLKRKYGNE